MAKQITSGSKEAVTGYRFQFLWTARRCLSMLRHDSPVTQVVVEGLHPDDEMNFGRGPETFLGIDVAEYHGGNRIETANKVILSQLKCGISHPDRKWTVARLCRRKGNSLKSSVIGRLASAFAGIYDRGRTAILDKVAIQVVSNCPLDHHVRQLVLKAQNVLQSLDIAPKDWQFRHLKNAGLSKKGIQDLQRLYKATGLRSNQFCVFLSCLDLSTFDAESPVLQRVRLTGDILAFDRIYPDEGLRRLYELIEELAAKPGRAIRKEDVLNCLGTNETNFFPAPCHVKRPPNLIETKDCRDLARLLVKPHVHRVLVYGKAGVGKSMSVAAVEKLLPKGSVVVLYDCYAGGDTRTPNKFRFPESVLCTQFVNELSLRTNQCIYLVKNRASQSDFWERFETAVNEAATILAKLNALLVLVVDAADNAAESYSRERDSTPEFGFLPRLWSLSLPSNVRLVMTCRTHRRDALQSPANVEPFELQGFREEDSLLYLQQTFPGIHKVVGKSFHRATAGVPRLQYYWLSELREQTSAQASEEIGRRQSFGLDELYDDWLSSAKTILPKGLSSTQVVGLLRVQAGPLSLDVLSACLGIDESVLLRFCQGLEPGVILETNRVTLHFRDEDFETYLDKQLTESDVKSAHDALATYSLETIEDGGYGTRNACRHLLVSERHGELLRTVLGRTGVNSIADPIERTQCERERINLGFRCASRLKDCRSALQLLFEVGRVNRTQTVRCTALAQHAELALRHGRYKALLDSLETHGDLAEIGKSHFRIASWLSAHRDLKRDAANHLRKGCAWLRGHILEREKHHLMFDYTVADSARYAIAVLNLHGPDAAEQVLRRWLRPEDRLEALCETFRHLANICDRRRALSILKRCPAIGVARAAAMAGMFISGVKPSKRDVAVVTDRLQRWLVKYTDGNKIIRSWIVSFLELATVSDIPHEVLSGIIDHLSLAQNDRLRRFFSASQWARELDNYARLVALKCHLASRPLSVGDLFPLDRKSLESVEPGESRTHYDNETKQAVGQVELLIPGYVLRAQTLTQRRSTAWMAIRLRPLIEKWISSVSGHWDRPQPLYTTNLKHR